MFLELLFKANLFSVLWSVLFHSSTDVGIFAGLLHPILGMDHLLAMVSVGLLSAQMGGKAIWTVPATFVSVMTVGGILGIFGVPIPFVEIGIALSVVALGIALVSPRKLPVSLAMVFVGIFAIFHGHAHGAELPALSETALDVITYIFGFLLATATLHLIGALIGQMALSSQRGATVLRLSGVLIAAAGVFILFG